MLDMLPRATPRARPARRIHDAAQRLAAIASRRWFLDRHAEFWLRELGTRWSLTERRARVVAVIDETPDTRTLVLAPGRAWPGHRAGQYVPVELEVDGVRTRRCYSISSGASSGSSSPGARRIAITVRRVPGGRVSTALHQLRRGDLVGVGEPAGDFVLDTLPARLLFVAGGSGITPIIAILRDLVARPRADLAAAPADVIVLHASRTPRDAIFGAELASLATRFPWLRLHAWHDDRAGRLDATALHTLVPDLADRETFVCGPPGLIDLITAASTRSGARHPLHVERFVASPTPATTASIRLLRSGTDVIVAGPGPLLAQLERAGQRPAHGCRIGVCHACRCHKRSGTVEDLTTGAVSSEPDQDIRLCVSLARSDLELEL